VVSALAAGLAVGLELKLATRLANLAMGVAAGQPGMAVAQGTDLIAMLTPQGRALRKIVATEVAVEQVDRWRRMGLRTGLITTTPRRFSRARLETARAACDRLVLGVEAAIETDDEATRRALADAAGLANVDLVCLFPQGTQTETLLQLRPDLLIDSAPAASLADMVRGWGGQVLAG
jgi:bifunctional ADP-heptose synthase (sugar kinase/adenylyltransferase)